MQLRRVSAFKWTSMLIITVFIDFVKIHNKIHNKLALEKT